MTPADKHTFWATIAPPARLTWHQIAAVTGIPLWTVMDLIAAARAVENWLRLGIKRRPADRGRR